MQGLHEDGMARYIALRFTVTGLTEPVTSTRRNGWELPLLSCYFGVSSLGCLGH